VTKFWVGEKMLRKAVVPAAGLGTRLLPITKELPKEMLPLFFKGKSGGLRLKPVLQAVFEQLYDVGFREFCFIVGRGKRAIADHFAADPNFLETLKKNGKNEQARELKEFYRKVDVSSVVFLNQPEPKGFGDAVLRAKPFVSENFLVHAGDTYIISSGHNHLIKLFKLHEELEANAIFLVQEVEDPRQFGVMDGKEVGENVYDVRRVVEKPEKPATNLAIMPIYVFNPVIFKALEVTRPGKGGEIQLTDGVQRLIEWGLKVAAVKLEPEETRLDIGNPESCWEALSLSYQYFQGWKKAPK
jgi:UTP--glucose-1-phosphate uridylyltransferase